MKKITIIIVFVIIAALGFYLYQQKELAVIPAEEKTIPLSPIEIEIAEIRKENYTGSRPVISGENKLASAARAYAENTIAEFEAEANIDVPQMRKDFGVDSLTASYSIDMRAEQSEGKETKSIIMSTYVYTGGAHGSSSFKTFTAAKSDGQILTLSDIIKNEKEKEFTDLVKTKLLVWQVAPNEGPVVFEDTVAELSFDSFSNWSLDQDDLIIYFSQYEVGPGVLGAFALPVPLLELADYLL